MKMIKLSLAVFLFSTASVSFAQSTDTAPVNSDDGWFKRHYDATENVLDNLYENGRLSMVLSGYAYHDRNTYDTTHLLSLNERAWGIGMDKELRDDKDNEESIQFLLIADSHNSPQITASYNYYWMEPIGGNLEAGIGYSTGLISRPDIFNGVPFPGILPGASVGTRDVKLLFTYIPKVSGTVNGNVLYVALRFNLK